MTLRTRIQEMRIPNGNCIEIYILAEQRVEKINFVTLRINEKGADPRSRFQQHD